MIPGLGARTLVFAHLPKTAGTSVAGLLATRFSPGATLGLRGLSDDTADAVLSTKESYRFIHGHVPYDIRRSFATPPFMFTILRDPIERAISAYSHLRHDSSRASAPGVSASRAAAVAASGRLSLADFARSDFAERHTGNRQVMMLSEAFDQQYFIRRTEARRVQTQADLDLACENLRECDSFGLTEQLDTTMELLSYALYTEFLGTPRRANVTANRPAADELDADTLDVLHERTQLDRSLYRVAADLLEARRRAMLRDLLAQRGGRHHGVDEPITSICRFDAPIPGEGWYAPERAGDGWLSWTGPTTASWLGLGAPAHPGDIDLEIDVVHAVSQDQLHGVELLANGHRLSPSVTATADGHRVAAGVPQWALGPPGASNRIEIIVPFVRRPCDVSSTNPDSRELGLAISRVALVAVT